MLIPPIAQHTKAELVKMINKLEGPKVTVNKRKDVLIEILMDRMPFVDENGKEPVSYTHLTLLTILRV